MELKTPLYDCHVAAEGKIVPFAGYLLPIQYEGGGVIKEHMAVRQAVGLFDVSHMGELTLKGPDALANLQRLLTNDFANLQPGQARYSPMCYAEGGVVDDLLVYMMAAEDYLLVVNASNRHKDAEWIKSQLQGNVTMEDISDTIAQLALQGPKAEAILQALDTQNIPQGNYTFTAETTVGGVKCLLSRTGYTGEDGFELYCANEDAAPLWNILIKAGEPFGIMPAGLGARDTLRMEAAMPLYGHEMTQDITPLEAGLGFFVKVDKAEDFLGKSVLAAQKGNLSRRRAGLKITGKGIVREGCKVYVGDEEIGFTTSGTHLPYLGQAVALALLKTGYHEAGQVVEVDVRGRRIAAEVVKLPFYKREK